MLIGILYRSDWLDVKYKLNFLGKAINFSLFCLLIRSSYHFTFPLKWRASLFPTNLFLLHPNLFLLSPHYSLQHIENLYCKSLRYLHKYQKECKLQAAVTSGHFIGSVAELGASSTMFRKGYQRFLFLSTLIDCISFLYIANSNYMCLLSV